MTPQQRASLRQYIAALGIPLFVVKMTPYLDWLISTLRGAV